jgi:rhodanese-related sulfurtransferase
MTVVKQAIIELLLLTIASVGVALAANQIRERKSIELTKNYFNRGSASSKVGEKDTRPDPGPASGIEAPKKTAEPTSPVPAAQPAKTAPSAAAKPAPSEVGTAAPKHLDHDFKTITVDEVHEVLDDPKTAQGLNIFVDARDDEHFAEGHIPGAMQCFPYEAKKCLDRVKAAATGAERVIVYCGGGDCEDSIFMSSQLQEAGVPDEAIFLFEGGWKELSGKGLRTETGKR